MNRATQLTLVRLLIAPLFALAFVKGYPSSPAWLWVALVVLFMSELTDVLDGRVARRHGQVTDFGKVFDPVSDSLARLTAFVTFMSCGIIPLWMFLVFLYRDLLMSLLRIVCASQGTVVAARRSGKAKAVLQAGAILGVVVLAILQAYRVQAVPPTLWGYHPGFWLIVIPAVFTVLSVLDYVVPNWHAITSGMEPTSESRKSL